MRDPLPQQRQRRSALSPPPSLPALSKNATTNCILPTVVYRKSCSMIAWRLGAASVMPADLSCLATIDLGTLAYAILKLSIDVKI